MCSLQTCSNQKIHDELNFEIGESDDSDEQDEWMNSIILLVSKLLFAITMSKNSSVKLIYMWIYQD